MRRARRDLLGQLGLLLEALQRRNVRLDLPLPHGSRAMHYEYRMLLDRLRVEWDLRGFGWSVQGRGRAVQCFCSMLWRCLCQSGNRKPHLPASERVSAEW